ncbi:hypothetical protein L9F63_001280, partial [Diploptera punctata]
FMGSLCSLVAFLEPLNSLIKIPLSPGSVSFSWRYEQVKNSKCTENSVESFSLRSHKLTGAKTISG